MTDNQLGTGGAVGTLTFDFTLFNGNRFANGGQDVVFGFNLLNETALTYSGLSSDFRGGWCRTADGGSGPERW